MKYTLQRLDKISIIAGYNSAVDLLLRFALPVLIGISIASYVVTLLPGIPSYTPLIMVGIGFLFIVFYPVIKLSEAKADVDNHLHYFITYAGTISTMNIARGLFFKKISEKKVFGGISDIFQRIRYLAKSWNLGFARSCRIMVRRSPSVMLGDFLDRLAVVMDFGQDLEIFLYDEQESVLDDYRVQYTKSLETIKMLQELFVAITISFAFLLGVVLLAPLLLEVKISTVLLIAVAVLAVIDVGLIFAIKSFIPRDKLASELPEKNAAIKKIKNYFYGALGISILLFAWLFFFTNVNFVLSMGIASLPMIIPGYMANVEENNINRRDKQFPTYVRVLGTAIEVRNGGVISALESTQSHDFGVLNDMSIALYRRLRLGNDKFKSWYYFAVSSGSNLIANFSKIFSESIYLGGNAEKIGEIVSSNLIKLISMRKLRQQIAGGLRGAFYGNMIGLVSVVYISSRVSQSLIDLFNVPAGNGELSNFVGSIFTVSGTVNFELVLIYIGLMVFIQALSSSIIMKLVDGGLLYSAVFDYIVLLAIGVVLALVLPGFVDSVMPSFSNLLPATNATTPT